VIPDCPTANNHSLLEEDTVIPLLTIYEHFNQHEISVPFQTQPPPESLTKITLEE
jgi:hypothetical protein